jgi:hypothetical protein
LQQQQNWLKPIRLDAVHQYVDVWSVLHAECFFPAADDLLLCYCCSPCLQQQLQRQVSSADRLLFGFAKRDMMKANQVKEVEDH